MPIMKKQMKITKLFRKRAFKPIPSAQLPDDCDELEEEIKQLELRVKEKQDELFELQRNSFRCKATVSSGSRKSETFVRPNKIILTNSVESLKQKLELMSMLTGMEVQSYEAEDHCCVLYHMQHTSKHRVTHGLKVALKSGQNHVSSSSLPLGFNLAGVLEGFDNVMLPECLCAIRSALVAYYDRLDQYEALKDLLNIEAQLFKIIDGSHMEVTFSVCLEDEEERLRLTLILDYGIFDVRPKLYAFKESDLPEDLSDLLGEQCAVFKKKTLIKAFKAAFINGPFKLVRKISGRPVVERRRRRKPKRHPPNMHYNNDDTFRPEDTDFSDDDDD